MKSIIITLVFSLIATLGFAQSATDKWPALKEMHGVISETYHPSEEGNLVPAKARAKELVTKATALNKSKIPAGLDAARLKPAMANLLIETKKVEAMVKEGADDKSLMDQMAIMHDAYHQISGLCMAEE